MVNMENEIVVLVTFKNQNIVVTSDLPIITVYITRMKKNQQH